MSGPLLWHTNHGRYLPGAEPSPEGTSAARGHALSALAVPQTDPGPSWFLHVLAEAPLPDGVRADRSPGEAAVTLCTFIADLTAGQAIIAVRDEQPVTIALSDLAEGNPHHQHQLTTRALVIDHVPVPGRAGAHGAVVKALIEQHVGVPVAAAVGQLALGAVEGRQLPVDPP